MRKEARKSFDVFQFENDLNICTRKRNKNDIKVLIKKRRRSIKFLAEK